MERFIDKVVKVYRESADKANEALDVFIKDFIYPKVETAASERKDKVTIVIPTEYTTISAIRYISYKLSKEGFGVYMYEKDGGLRLTVSGWIKPEFSQSKDIEKLVHLMFGF
jgi:hypothetical protein